MYEEFFGMTHRPFSANPNAAEFTAIGPIQDALESVLNCLTHSRGVAVVTGATGMGKTAFCRHVAHILRETHLAVYPTAASLETRRAFLQSILYELGADYLGLDEEEARLRLYAAAQESKRQGKILLLIIDDAHLLHGRLLDELRSLVDYTPHGEALFRIILCGQFALEETLADPSHASFAQRIGSHVCLETYSLEQSARFLIDRLRSSGVESLDDVMTSEALELICRAADGNLRCLCQLVDHALLLAFAQECRPVDEETVRAAFDDLRDLPLPWGEISPATAHSDRSNAPINAEAVPPAMDGGQGAVPSPSADGDADFSSSIGDMAELPASTMDVEVEYAVIEVGAEVPRRTIANEDVAASGSITGSAPASVSTSPWPPAMPNKPADLPAFAPFAVEEIPVLDRYAALDRLAELPVEKHGSVRIPACDFVAPEAVSAAARLDCDGIERQLLSTIQETLQKIRQFDRDTSTGDSHSTSPVAVNPHDAVPAPDRTEPVTEDAVHRRFGLLFTRLRERRRRLGGE